MTTATWSATHAHDSDAAFRLWGDEFSTYLQSTGLVQTADTGQIDWTTVTRAGVNADAGYEIFYLNDSLHATAPIYIKIWYGTGSSTSRARIRVQVGEGSDGSGNLTGTVSQALIIAAAAGPVSGAKTSYCCVDEGFVGIVFLVSGSASSLCWPSFMVARTVNASGAITNVGYAIVALTNQSTDNGLPHCQYVSPLNNFIGAYFTPSTSIGAGIFVFPGVESSSNVGGDSLMFPALGVFPQCLPLKGLATALIADLALGSTATATLVGSETHTYLQVSTQFGRLGCRASSSVDLYVGLCMLWE